ncbi:MAG: alpha-L-fucosidase [Verrucomicrobiota bacterium]
MKPLIYLSLSILALKSWAEPYEPTWDSLAKHQAAPEWLEDAKLGIYFHWGPYSVPAFGNEWYPRNMHHPRHREYHHHARKYGDPADFGYHDFVPMFTAEHYDPEDWAELFHQSGARFAGPVAEHHDGYAMWDSELTPWNSKDTGPKRDILGELFEELRKRDMKTIATFHHARNLGNRNDGDSHYYNYNPNWPPASDDPELRLLYGNMPESEWLERMWMGKIVEVVDKYQPDIVWFDSWLDRIPEDYRKSFSAYYLNEADKWGRDVVIIRKQNDLPLTFSMNDHEKAREPDIEEALWMTDDTISTGSWCYTENLRIKPTDKVLHALIDTVSKNGVVLLNLSPRSDGVIPDDQREVLQGLGNWLTINGESIYETRPWVVAGEGPVIEPEGGFRDRKEFLRLEYSAKDIRFTRSKDNRTLYVIPMGWPGSRLVVETFEDVDLSGIESVTFLGTGEDLEWKETSRGMSIEMPRKPGFDYAYPIRVAFKDAVPDPR